MRHDRIRNLEATILKDVCKDVRIEPELLPIGDTSTSSTNVADKARLDVSAVGVWSPMERTFFDERVVHPNSTKEKMSRRSIKKMRKKRRTSTINELYKLRRPRSPP